jgi:hypothetical protein
MGILIIIGIGVLLFLIWQGRKVVSAILDNQHPQFMASLDDLHYDEDMKRHDFDQTVKSAQKYVDNDFRGRNQKLMKSVARNRAKGRSGFLARRLESQLEMEEAIKEADIRATPYRLKTTRINPKTGHNTGSTHNYYRRARIGQRHSHVDEPTRGSERASRAASKGGGLLKKMLWDDKD